MFYYANFIGGMLFKWAWSGNGLILWLGWPGINFWNYTAESQNQNAQLWGWKQHSLNYQLWPRTRGSIHFLSLCRPLKSPAFTFCPRASASDTLIAQRLASRMEFKWGREGRGGGKKSLLDSYAGALMPFYARPGAIFHMPCTAPKLCFIHRKQTSLWISSLCGVCADRCVWLATMKKSYGWFVKIFEFCEKVGCKTIRITKPSFI